MLSKVVELEMVALESTEEKLFFVAVVVVGVNVTPLLF